MLKRFNTDELIKYLNGVINGEMRKPIPEMDSELISECADWLLEIDGSQVNIPEEKIQGITQSIIDRHYKPKRRKLMNFIRIIAACVIIMLCSEFISLTVFHEDIIEDIYDGTQYILHYYILDDISPEWHQR